VKPVRIGSWVLAAGLLGLLSSNAFAGDRVFPSRWSEAPPRIDGSSAEWRSDALVHDRETGVDCAFRNDGGNLYILIVVRAAGAAAALDSTGATVFIQPVDAGPASRGIWFVWRMVPAERFLTLLENQGQTLTQEQKIAILAEPRHPVFWALTVDGQGTVLEPDPVARGAGAPEFRRSRTGVATYEFRLPLPPEGGDGETPRRPVFVSLEWGGSSRKTFTPKSTWQSPNSLVSDGVFTGSGETRGQEFLSQFDVMSRQTLDAKKYSLRAEVRLACAR
jgi:hypothetical protein